MLRQSFSEPSRFGPSMPPPVSLHASALQPPSRCRFLARALYTRKGCRDIQEFNVEVFELSGQHLRLRSPLAGFLPDNFSLVLGARQYGIGCAVLSRVNNTVWCQLIRRESEPMVSFLAGLRDPKETLEELHDPLFPRARMATRRRSDGAPQSKT